MLLPVNPAEEALRGFLDETLDAAGRISGTVENSSGAPVETWVDLYHAGTWDWAGLAYSSGGSYSFEGLRAGSYRVWFGSTGDYLGEYWNNRVVTPDDIVVADGGDTTTWIGMTRTIRKPGRYLDYGLYGSLGVGLPYALAAKLRYPDQRVCLLTGDGSVGFNFMEFENSIRKNLPFVAVMPRAKTSRVTRKPRPVGFAHAVIPVVPRWT